MNQAYLNHFVTCECGHSIPLPHPSLRAVVEDQTTKTKAIRKAVFACTECGLVSGYSSQDVRAMLLPTPGPHQREERTLGYIVPRCDKENCAAPRRLYILGSGPNTVGELTMKVPPRKWRFDASATCESGHILMFDGERHKWCECDEYPF